MQILKLIIDSFGEKSKPKIVDIDKSRPEKCPRCGQVSREWGILWIIGHGTYERWACIPDEVRISVRRFLCKNCRRTCSVLPHGLLPRFQYSAFIILSCLQQFYLQGKTEAAVISSALKDKAKQNCGILRRWGAGFLIHSVLWGWLGSRLGVKKDTVASRDRIRIHLERFFRNFKDRTTPDEFPNVEQIVQISLAEMVFDRGNPAGVLHATCEGKSGFFHKKARFTSNTHAKEQQRAPP